MKADLLRPEVAPPKEAPSVRLRPAALLALVLAAAASGCLMTFGIRGPLVGSPLHHRNPHMDSAKRWPPHEFVLPPALREDGIVSRGSPGRARAVFARLLAGKPLSVGEWPPSAAGWRQQLPPDHFGGPLPPPPPQARWVGR